MNGERVDEIESKPKSHCFSNLLGIKGKTVGCFNSDQKIYEDNDAIYIDQHVSVKKVHSYPPDNSISTNSLVKSDENIDDGSRITNVALCCAITEAVKTPATFRCVGHSTNTGDSYQRCDKITSYQRKPSILADGENSNVANNTDENEIRTNFKNSSVIPYTKQHLGHVSFNGIGKTDMLFMDELEKENMISKKQLDTSCSKTRLESTSSSEFGAPKIRRAKSMSSLPAHRSTSTDSMKHDSIDGSLESLIKHNLSSGRVIHPVPTQKAKNRNYLQGRSLLGMSELERVFPKREVSIFVATWNMNGEEPPCDISELLLPENIENLPDIYVIGTQESCSETSEWQVTIQETIGPSHVLFHSETLGVLYLGIYIRRELIWFCSEPEDTSFSVRPGSAFKTKGAVAICFFLFGTSFLFVTSHLTAHDDKVQERIHDVKRIVKSLELPKELPIRHRSRDVTQNFDYVFWCGDLNFRLTQPRAQVIDWLSKQKFPLESSLQSPFYDQLASSMKKGLVFRGFQESPLTFPPTYKYDPGTSNFDTSHKQRVPSYTDRILYKCRKSSNILLPLSSNNTSVHCLTYSSVPSFCTSDHKPVWALFKCKIRPGSDNIPLAAGLFNREVYLDGLKRRAQSRKTSTDSSVCLIQ